MTRTEIVAGMLRETYLLGARKALGDSTPRPVSDWEAYAANPANAQPVALWRELATKLLVKLGVRA